MRRFVRLLAGVSCFVLACAAEGQTPRPQGSSAKKPTPRPSVSATIASSPASASTTVNRPQFRPAVLPVGADSLVNRIDVNELLQKGQKDGAVQFSVVVEPDGKATDPATYHALANSQALEAEVSKQLANARFTPPIYQHQTVRVLLYGTVLFAADEVPHLRILLNQDPGEIEAGSDFIGPQPVIGADSKFKGLQAVEDMPLKMTGVVNAAIGVNAKGEMRKFAVANEEPPLLGLANLAATDFDGAKFIPGFRDGDATESESLVSLCYTSGDDAQTESGFELEPPPEPPQS